MSKKAAPALRVPEATILELMVRQDGNSHPTVAQAQVRMALESTALVRMAPALARTAPESMAPALARTALVRMAPALVRMALESTALVRMARESTVLARILGRQALTARVAIGAAPALGSLARCLSPSQRSSFRSLVCSSP